MSAYKWKSEETFRLITFRAGNEKRFILSKFAAKQLWETFVTEAGLVGKVTGQQASKKWENLKRKYKDLRTPRSGSGTDAGEITAASWQYFEAMHEVLGARPSVDPPVVVASFVEEDPTPILMEMVEPSASPPPCRSPPPCATEVTTREQPATPAPSLKRRASIVDFLTSEAELEQRRHEESEAKTARFLELFERMVDKL